MSKRIIVTKSFQINKELELKVNRMAESYGLTFSNFVRNILTSVTEKTDLRNGKRKK